MAKIDPNTTEEQLFEGGNYRSMLAPHLHGIRSNIIGAQSVKDRVEGVILPSYDYDLDTCDAAFPLSVGSCWKSTPDKDNPKHFLPNAWAVPLLCYTFMGENNEHFISPLNRKFMIDSERWSVEDFADAFNDLWCSIKFDKGLTDRDKEYYLKKPDFRTDAKIPARQSRFFSLADVTAKDSRDRPDTQLVIYTSAAHSYLVEQMRWYNDPGVTPRDPRWPRYLLGDPTSPEAAMVWTVDKIQLDPKDPQATNCLMWTTKREILDSPLHTKTIPESSLAKRFLMVDPANWNIPTYQEMVDFMVVNAHEEVTTEMIKAACGHRADVGERKFRARSGAARQQDSNTDSYNPMDAAVNAASTRSFAPTNDVIPTSPAATVAPEATLPATAPAATVPATVPTTIPAPVTYLAGVAGGVPAQMTVAQLAAGPADLMVNVAGVWKSVAESGLVPVQVVPSTVPVTTVPTTVPVTTVPSHADGGRPVITPEEQRRKIMPDELTYAQLPADRKAQLDELSAELAALKNQGIDDTPAHLMDQLVAFLGM